MLSWQYSIRNRFSCCTLTTRKKPRDHYNPFQFIHIFEVKRKCIMAPLFLLIILTRSFVCSIYLQLFVLFFFLRPILFTASFFFFFC